MTIAPPNNAQILSYGILALPLAFAGLPLYIHAPDFYTRVHGMELGAIGAVLLCVRMLEAFLDPALGFVCDRLAPYRTALLVTGSALLITGITCIFWGPISMMPVPVWLGLSLLISAIGFSLLNITVNVIGAFWHPDAAQKIRISSYREGFGLAGLLLASILPALLSYVWGATYSYILIPVVLTGLSAASLILFFSANSRRENKAIPADRSHPTKFLFLNILCGENKYFYGTCFLTYLAGAFPAVLVLFFVQDYLGVTNQAGIFLILYFISAAAFLPVWAWITKKTDARTAWLLAMSVSILSFVSVILLQQDDAILFGVICILSGCALGADLAIPPVMLAQRLEAQFKTSESGQAYAILNLLPKIALAIASGIAFFILDRFGFVVGGENSADALFVLLMLYSLLPCGLKAASAILLWKNTLHTGTIHEKIIHPYRGNNADV
jgi:Na+/melibiose symporter-like transporter